MRKAKRKKDSSSEEEEDRKGKWKYIASITEGNLRERNPSNKTMKRRITKLMEINKEGETNPKAE